MASRSAEYYRTHTKAREKKQEYDKKYGKASRKGKDASHTSHGIVYKSSSSNRGSKSDTAGDKRARGGKKK